MIVLISSLKELPAILQILIVLATAGIIESVLVFIASILFYCSGKEKISEILDDIVVDAISITLTIVILIILNVLIYAI